MNQNKISFPRYTALIKKKERQARIKELAWKVFTQLLEVLGILVFVFYGYIFLSAFFSYEPSDPEDRPEKADYSPYSGWSDE